MRAGAFRHATPKMRGTLQILIGILGSLAGRIESQAGFPPFLGSHKVSNFSHDMAPSLDAQMW